jgi:uncharacterized membrane protein YeiH
MQYFLEHGGVCVGAITGVLAGRGKQVDLFGVLVIALVAAFGGGTLRDVLIGATPVFWASDPLFLLNASVSSVIMFYVVRFHEPPEMVLLVVDAFFLAVFTIIGTRKAMSFSVAPSVAIAMGVITGVAGGILRDVLLNDLPLVFRRGTYLYATAALVGACLFVGLVKLKVSPQTCTIVGTVAVLVLRLVGIRWRLTLPQLRLRQENSPGTEPPIK